MHPQGIVPKANDGRILSPKPVPNDCKAAFSVLGVGFWHLLFTHACVCGWKPRSK